MKIIQSLKIRARLAAGFLAVIALVGASALTGVWKLGELGNTVDKLVSDDAAKLIVAQRWEAGIAMNLVRTHTSLLLEDRTLVDELKREMDATSQRISEAQKEVEAMADSDEDKQALAAIGELRKRYRGQREALLKRKASGENVREELANVLEPLARSYLAAVHGFVELQQRDLQAAKQSADEAVRRTRWLMALLGAMGLVVAAGAAIAIAQSIVTPIRKARESANRISGGDLTERLAAVGRDEIAEMMAALSGMQESLRAIVGKVGGFAESVSTASSQIAVGNTDLSARTEEQASSLEETAASIEEMTATVNQNAENSRQANELALSAAQVAERGGKVVDQVVQMMDGIQKSSRKIADIIGVIDSIAFQTNILALNAAVEAARAGEQGRGFAVVAAEVRSLAQRSAEAAKEIKGLITDSVNTVNAGAKLADDAGSTMVDVVTSVKRVSDIIGEIAAATKEQSSGIAQVNQAVGELDKVTQQNASLVEESTAASESLKELARELAEAVAVFRIEGSTSARIPGPALRAPAPGSQRPLSLAAERA